MFSFKPSLELHVVINKYDVINNIFILKYMFAYTV